MSNNSYTSEFDFLKPLTKRLGGVDLEKRARDRGWREKGAGKLG